MWTDGQACGEDDMVWSSAGSARRVAVGGWRGFVREQYMNM